MKKKFLIIFFSVSLLSIFFEFPAHSFMVKFKEDWFRLYHIHYQQYPDDCIENIYWLEKAAQADFCNPLYAYAKIDDEKSWQKYRYLFQMHINLKLVEQHLRLGRTYDKKVAHFYDAPWKDEYIHDLEKALDCYNAGFYYWKEAKLWAEKANAQSFDFLFVTDLQFWEDERERIKLGSLDYEKMLTRETERVKKVRDEFLAMESEKY